MKFVAAALLIPSLLQAPAPTQNGPAGVQWLRKDYTDSLSGVPLVSFTLTGWFLDPPQHGHAEAPTWVTVCDPKPTHNGKDLYDGLLVKAYIDFGSVLSSTGEGLPVVYRLDDGKPKAECWSAGTAGTAAFLNSNTLNTVLYGRFLPHRAASNPATNKVCRESG